MADSKRGAGSDRSRAVPGGLSLRRRASLLILLAAAAFVLASMVAYDPADPPSHLVYPPNHPVANWCGPFGAAIAYTLFKLLGFGAWVLASFLTLGILSAAAGGQPRHALVRVLGLAMLTASLSCLQHLILPGSGSMPDLAGGLIGSVGTTELTSRFGGLGAGLMLAVMAFIGAVVAMDEWLLAAFGWMWAKTREHGVPAAKVAGVAAGGVALAGAAATARVGGSLFTRLVARIRGSHRAVRLNDVDDDVPSPEAGATRRSGRVGEGGRKGPVAAAEPLEIDDPDLERVEGEIEPKPARGKKPAPARAMALDEDEEAQDEIDDSADAAGAEEDDHLPGAPQVFDAEALRQKIAKLPIAFGQQNKQIATDADLRKLRAAGEDVPDVAPELAADAPPPKAYQFPGMDLLENPEENFNLKLEEYVREQASALESALQQYRIAGSVVGIESGPVITLYDVRLAPGTKVAALSAVASDIARALKAVNIRIVPNMVGRDTVGIEVPNAQKEKVRLKELMGQTEKFSAMKLPMFLGKDASGEPLIEDLAKMPHMLIAGTTGSGKSVCMNTIIMSFLYTKKPSELKLVLVDPKMVEMSQFKDIPHLMCPVVTEMGKAAAILEWATTKMDERYALLAEAGCRDIAAYNDLPWEELKSRFGDLSPEEEARVPRKLPYMVFIIDELADLMMTAKEVESFIIRIAQKARAVGIHLILATQRPQANVVTGLIKSNMPCRVSFKVASGMDSRIVLDQKGGELLLGHGDMLFLSPRSSKLSRAQGTLVDDQEIRRVVRFMRDVAGPSFERQLMTLRRSDQGSDEDRILQSQNNSSASLAAAQEDPMFMRAVDIVLETKRGSVSLLQRRLAIGYTRASRLIDLMGIAGILGEHKGSVAREVQTTPEEWAAMKALAAEQAASQGIAFPTEDGEQQAALFPEAKPDAEEAPFDATDADDSDDEDGDDSDDEGENVGEESDDAEASEEFDVEEDEDLAEDEDDTPSPAKRRG